MVRLSLICLMSLALAGPVAAAERSPVVVELFTSQGCNSCPPADAFLGELAKRPDIIALSFHVDYWDYIGWKDPFAQRAFTERQRTYSRTLAQRYVYTPQMVIDGHLQGVGSDRRAIEHLIREAAKTREAVNRPSLRRTGDDIQIGDGASTSAVVWLAIYDAAHRTPVARGENAGKQLANHHVVREWRALGRYDGKSVTLPLGIDATTLDKRGCAVIVQADTPTGPGAVLAALSIPAPP
jgi:hypothetical protein